MKKLLLLALLGLGLGGSAWKVHNPDASLDDLKSQALGTVDRLKAGVTSVVHYPATQAEKETLEQRLSAVEQTHQSNDSAALAAEFEALNNKLEQNANTLAGFEAMNESVAPLEDVTQAIAQLDTALQDTRARTDAGNVRLDTIERRLELLVRRLDEQTTDTQLQALSESVAQMQSETAALRDESTGNSASVEERLTDMNEATSNLALRLDTLAGLASSGSSGTNDTDGASVDASSQNAIAALSSSIDGRLNEIEQRLTSVNADSRKIETLTTELAQAQSRITELAQQDARTDESLASLNDSVTELNTAGESLSIDAIQAKIRTELEKAQSQFDNSAEQANTAQIEALLDATRNRIQTLERRVQDLPAASTEADNAAETQSALQAQIADLEQKLEGLTKADPELQSTVNNVRQQVEQLSAQGFVTQDELRASAGASAVEYKVYFDRNSAEVTSDAAQVLNSFIAQEKNRTTGVSIFGFTDRSGSAAYNQQLALQRATNVRSYLIQNGLDFTKIKALSGLGEDAAAAVLPDEADDAQQRVVVLFADQP